MKATELRIGNLVSQGVIDELLEGYAEVHPLTARRSEQVNYEDITPIPLTEEWLLKFGLIKGTLGNRWYMPYQPHEIHQTSDSFFRYSCGNYIGDRIKYAHQLQNLYFALTNSELQIKQTA